MTSLYPIPETAICKPCQVQGQRLQNSDCNRRGSPVRSRTAARLRDGGGKLFPTGRRQADVIWFSHLSRSLTGAWISRRSRSSSTTTPPASLRYTSTESDEQQEQVTSMFFTLDHYTREINAAQTF